MWKDVKILFENVTSFPFIKYEHNNNQWNGYMYIYTHDGIIIFCKSDWY